MPAIKDGIDLWEPDATYIIGHQRPDMDAIGSALGYAWYLTKMGQPNVVAARAGQVGTQASFVMHYFSSKPPKVLSNAAPTFAHVAERQSPVRPADPLSEAISRLADGARLVPVVDDSNQLVGGLSPLVLARAYGRLTDGNKDGKAPTCGEYVEASPTVQANDRISDHRTQLLRKDGDHFLVVDGAKTYVGLASRQCLIAPARARLILVDHNELVQAVPGADEAEIVGVLDHHRLGNPPTAAPISFVVEPVGSTSTLVAEACRRDSLKPPENLAGVLLSGILSDTLVFRSPTTTDRDREAATWLAEVSRMDIRTYGQQLIHASPGLADRTPDEILDGDRKTYEMAGKQISLAQIEVTGFQELPDHKPDLLDAMEVRRTREGLSLVCLMITDVISVQSRMLCVGETDILSGLPYKRVDSSEFDLGGVVSRKKQLVPALQSILEDGSDV